MRSRFFAMKVLFSNILFSVTDATYTYLDHLLNIDYYDEENDY